MKELTQIDKSKGDLVWMVGGKVRERILENMPFGILQAKKKELEGSGCYRSGVLLVAGWRRKLIIN